MNPLEKTSPFLTAQNSPFLPNTEGTTLTSSLPSKAAVHNELKKLESAPIQEGVTSSLPALAEHQQKSVMRPLQRSTFRPAQSPSKGGATLPSSLPSRTGTQVQGGNSEQPLRSPNITRTISVSAKPDEETSEPISTTAHQATTTETPKYNTPKQAVLSDPSEGGRIAKQQQGSMHPLQRTPLRYPSQPPNTVETILPSSLPSKTGTQVQGENSEQPLRSPNINRNIPLSTKPEQENEETSEPISTTTHRATTTETPKCKTLKQAVLSDPPEGGSRVGELYAYLKGNSLGKNALLAASIVLVLIPVSAVGASLGAAAGAVVGACVATAVLAPGALFSGFIGLCIGGPAGAIAGVTCGTMLNAGLGAIPGLLVGFGIGAAEGADLYVSFVTYIEELLAESENSKKAPAT